MKRVYIFFCLTFFFINISCIDDSSIEIVNKNEYKILIKKNFPIIDVRTPSEFWEGHIDNAINIDFNSNSFINEISKLGLGADVVSKGELVVALKSKINICMQNLSSIDDL